VDFAELFTFSTRDMLPRATRKGLVSYFDYQGPYVTLDFDEARLRRAMHRLQLGLHDVVHDGIVMLNAEVTLLGATRCRVIVSASGSSTDLAPADLARVLQRLRMTTQSDSAPSQAFSIQATGICPPTGAQVFFLSVASEGTAFTWRGEFDLTLPVADEAVTLSHNAVAWMIPSARLGLASVERRLRRMGWSVVRFDDLAAATLALGQLDGRSLPALLMKAEEADEDLASLDRLAAALPAAWTILAVVAGSPAVSSAVGQRIDVRVLPLSPHELDQITTHANSGSATGTPASAFAALHEGRRTILVVEDHPVNQLVARGMLEALGYEVQIAEDGAQAVAMCRAHPPDLVLMDLNMPVMGGEEAATTLRALQSVGEVPPFPILAATAQHRAEAQRACAESGMDGLVEKPLRMDVLGTELRRVLPAVR